jgi:hypothetical protein
MNGIWVLDRPASQGFYAVAGRLLFVQSLDRKLATLIERLFAGWQLTPVSSPDRNPDIKITFACGDLPQVPEGLYEFEVAEDGRCYSAGDEFYLVFTNSLLHLKGANASPPGPQASRLLVAVADANESGRRDACGPSVDVCVWVKRAKESNDAELARVTSFAVCAGLRRFGMFELHGAGVAVPETGAGVLIVGPSGSGKSTLTLQLARAGWGYLSDDELLLSLTGEEIEARGFRSFFALVPEDSQSSLKSCFEPADVFDAPRADRVTPRFLLFAAVSGTNETQLHELTQAETMSRLIRACPWATYDTAIAAANLQLLSRLARQAKGFNLMAGTDLLEPEQASRILGSVCRS